MQSLNLVQHVALGSRQTGVAAADGADGSPTRSPVEWVAYLRGAPWPPAQSRTVAPPEAIPSQPNGAYGHERMSRVASHVGE